MLGDLKDIIKQLNSASDVAVVGTAAIVGFVADAAINIVPLPIFTPGVCGVTAAGVALSAKRGWEAKVQARRSRNALTAYRWEAEKIADRLEAKRKIAMAEWLRFQATVAIEENDAALLRSAIEKAITHL